MIGFYIELKDNVKCTLQDVIDQKMQFKELELKTLTISLLQAVNEIHEDGYLYLSMKPSNICFTLKGEMFL